MYLFYNPTPRNGCFSGIFTILLTQHPAMLRKTVGEKGYVRYKQTDEMLFWTPPSLRTPPYMANATHPVALRGKSSQSKRINPYSQKTCEIFPTLLLCLRWRIEAGEKEKYNPFHSLKFRSIPTKFLLSRLSFPRLGRKYIIIQYIGEVEILCLK